jgi:biotin synthase
MRDIWCLINALEHGEMLGEADFQNLLAAQNAEVAAVLRHKADAVRKSVYGDEVFVRGLIEFTNFCKKDCYYCGLRRSNRCAKRYRLTERQVLDCCHVGYDLGFRTFVLQGGEDPGYTPERIANLVASIKKRWPECAVTLSVGEHPRNVYQGWFDAGADRYLLRHETADPEHYHLLHPKSQSLESRMKCLHDLKDIGYQVGCGFMVGSPGQSIDHIAKDLAFLQKFRPHMVGIGPFIPQKDTPFGGETAGAAELTVYLLSIIRLMLPEVLLPATTALGTIHSRGREMGFQAGANVCMPNLSPTDVREMYALYDNKLSSGSEAAECLAQLGAQIESAGYRLSMNRGDHIRMKGTNGYV